MTTRGATLPDDLPIVIAGSAPWESPPLNAHQIARRMAARGHPVLYVESAGLRPPALGSAHDRRRIVARLRSATDAARERAPGLHSCAPLALPGAASPWVRAASLRALGTQVRRSAQRLGFERPILWSFLPTGHALAAALDARLCVYHCVDDYAGNPGVDAAWIETLEARMLDAADLVFASSPVLAERLGRLHAEVRSMPNVADVARFAAAVDDPPPAPAWLAAIPRPRLVWTGNLAHYRIDPALLEASLAAHEDAQLVLVGAVGQGDLGAEAERWGVLDHPRVHRIAAQPHEALPAILAHGDVGLIPFRDNAHTRGSLPLKLWEYLAAGLPVVATALPNFDEVAAEALAFTAATPEGFATAVGLALAEPPERRAWRSRAAAAHGWPERIEVLCGELAAALARR